MDHFQKKTIRLVLSGIILFGVIEVAVIKWLLPAYYTHYLMLIPVYFLILGVGMFFLFAKMNPNRYPGREVSLLLLLNVVQMTLSFVLLFCYYFFIQVQKQTMLLAFCLFYLFFLFLKFYTFYNKGHL